MSSPPATNGNGSASARAMTPPHNLEAEQSVLGAILLSSRTLYPLVIEEGLRPEDFYRERHGTIYDAMLALYNESEPVDVVTVTDRLRQMGRLEEVEDRPPWTNSQASCRRRATLDATPRSSARTPSCGACSAPRMRSRRA